MTIPEWLKTLLELTAVRMQKPPLFGGFHIAAALLSVLIPFILAKRYPCTERDALIRRLHRCGWILAGLELYKQLFLYVVVNNMHYNFWYFPFQLCSMAMYLCILLPHVPHSLQDTILTFLFDFSLPGALLALAVPEDFLREYLSLTLHGFVWHAILVYIALSVLYSGFGDFSRRGYFRAAGLYLGLALCAVGLNAVLQPLAVYGGSPDLFYLSPYIKTGQIFFRDIAERWGILPELVIYVTLYLLLCALFHMGRRRFRPVS